MGFESVDTGQEARATLPQTLEQKCIKQSKGGSNSLVSFPLGLCGRGL